MISCWAERRDSHTKLWSTSHNTKRTRRAIDWNAVHARDEARTIRNKESIRERQKRLEKRHQRWLKC